MYLYEIIYEILLHVNISKALFYEMCVKFTFLLIHYFNSISRGIILQYYTVITIDMILPEVYWQRWCLKIMWLKNCSNKFSYRFRILLFLINCSKLSTIFLLQICFRHTWQSTKDRFLKKVVKNIVNYNIPLSAKKKFISMPLKPLDTKHICHSTVLNCTWEIGI